MEIMSPTERRKFKISILKSAVSYRSLNTGIREALNKSLDRFLLDYLESNVE